ncbi:hypothetical protein [Herbaspirillum seropedicae]|uniref:hypothetical protein n=1 Tax=Herbaspirillum seropedicae TaxID=964 RepID=UPI003FCDBA22
MQFGFLPSRAHDEAEYRVLPEARASLICSLLTPVGQILKRSIRKFQAASTYTAELLAMLNKATQVQTKTVPSTKKGA